MGPSSKELASGDDRRVSGMRQKTGGERIVSGESRARLRLKSCVLPDTEPPDGGHPGTTAASDAASLHVNGCDHE
jgi:hypothetical protein